MTPKVTFAKNLHDWEGSKWQVIFKIDGTDYCREPQAGSKPKHEVVTWSEDQIKMLERRHPGKTFTAVVERW